ncbi:cytochrome P450 [Micromonospora sp. M12]
MEELLRYLTVVRGGIPRVALEDMEIGGQKIRAGDGVLAMISLANRDPSSSRTAPSSTRTASSCTSTSPSASAFTSASASRWHAPSSGSPWWNCRAASPT